MTKTETRAEQIRRVFLSLGASVDGDTLLDKVILAGVMTMEEIQGWGMKAARKRCLDAITTPGPDGLPLALAEEAFEKDEDGEIVQVQVFTPKPLWTSTTIISGIRERLKHARGNLEQAERLLDEGRRRFPEDDWDFSDEWPGGWKPR